MKPFRIFLAVAVLSELSFSVASAQNSVETIRFNSGSCMGQCATYEVTFYRDGCAVYIGRYNVAMIGRYTAIVDFTTLEEALVALHFFDLQPRYGGDVIGDSKVDIISVEGKTNKTVETRSPDPTDMPKNLLLLERVLQGTIYNARWFNEGIGKQDHGYKKPSEVVPTCVWNAM